MDTQESQNQYRLTPWNNDTGKKRKESDLATSSCKTFIKNELSGKTECADITSFDFTKSSSYAKGSLGSIGEAMGDLKDQGNEGTLLRTIVDMMDFANGDQTKGIMLFIMMAFTCIFVITLSAFYIPDIVPDTYSQSQYNASLSFQMPMLISMFTFFYGIFLIRRMSMTWKDSRDWWDMEVKQILRRRQETDDQTMSGAFGINNLILNNDDDGKGDDLSTWYGYFMSGLRAMKVFFKNSSFRMANNIIGDLFCFYMGSWVTTNCAENNAGNNDTAMTGGGKRGRKGQQQQRGGSSKEYTRDRQVNQVEFNNETFSSMMMGMFYVSSALAASLFVTMGIFYNMIPLGATLVVYAFVPLSFLISMFWTGIAPWWILCWFFLLLLVLLLCVVALYNSSSSAVGAISDINSPGFWKTNNKNVSMAGSGTWVTFLFLVFFLPLFFWYLQFVIAFLLKCIQIADGKYKEVTWVSTFFCILNSLPLFFIMLCMVFIMFPILAHSSASSSDNLSYIAFFIFGFFCFVCYFTIEEEPGRSRSEVFFDLCADMRWMIILSAYMFFLSMFFVARTLPPLLLLLPNPNFTYSYVLFPLMMIALGYLFYKGFTDDSYMRNRYNHKRFYNLIRIRFVLLYFWFLVLLFLFYYNRPRLPCYMQAMWANVFNTSGGQNEFAAMMAIGVMGLICTTCFIINPNTDITEEEPEKRSGDGSVSVKKSKQPVNLSFQFYVGFTIWLLLTLLMVEMLTKNPFSSKSSSYSFSSNKGSIQNNSSSQTSAQNEKQNTMMYYGFMCTYVVLSLMWMIMFFIPALFKATDGGEGQTGVDFYSRFRIFAIFGFGIAICITFFVWVFRVQQESKLSMFINIMMILVILALVGQYMMSAEVTNTNKWLRFAFACLAFIPCMFTLAFGYLFELLGLGAKPSQTRTNLYKTLLGLVLASIAVFVIKQHLSIDGHVSPYNSNGDDSMLLINQPEPLNAQHSLSNFQFLTKQMSAFVDGSNNADNVAPSYHYGLTFWLFCDGNYGETNSYDSILSFGGYPTIQYNASENTLEILAISDNSSSSSSSSSSSTSTYSSSSSSSTKILYVQENVPLQKWNFYAINFDAGNVDIFINGTLVQSTQEVIPLEMAVTNPFLIVGCANNCTSNTSMCNLAFYNSPLTYQNVRSIYDSLSKTNPPAADKYNKDKIVNLSKSSNVKVNTSTNSKLMQRIEDSSLNFYCNFDLGQPWMQNTQQDLSGNPDLTNVANLSERWYFGEHGDVYFGL